MERCRASRIGVGCRKAVQSRLEVVRQNIVVDLVGSRRTGGRHGPGPQLSNDFFPCFRAVTGIFYIELVQKQSSGFQLFAVAGNTESIEKCTLRRKGFETRSRRFLASKR